MTAVDQPGIAAPPRSSFVTVVAWIFIVLSGFSTLIGALQNLMIRSMPFDQLNSALQDSTAAQLPAPARVIFSHFQLFFLVTFLLSLLMLISSIGLLRRHNWARLAFIGLLVLGIIYLLGGLFLQQSFMSSFNTINGVPSTANRHLLTDVLRGEWKFDGFIVSDWDAVAELMNHGVAASREEAAIKAITTGVDINI